MFATKSFSELGGDECDNFYFMNIKIDSLKFVEIGEFWEILKSVKFEFSVYDSVQKIPDSGLDPGHH